MSTDDACLALVGVGSNLESPIDQVERAIQYIENHQSISLVKKSSLYRSCPQGPQDQDDFINAVILISTELTPVQLLTELQHIEQSQGRVKTRHWGERIIDLDILFYEQETIKETKPDLLVPHPQSLQRDFVLVPAIEIAPDWLLPDGRALKLLLNQCISHQLERVS